jgi:hypothetical protein|tara:strand:+ start:74 stop:790 length:717 start_codon:yes stop_codon:yes gene_type:complete
MNYRIILGLLSLNLFIPFFVVADTYSASEKFYFGIGGGIISPNDVDINVKTAGTINGVTFSANIDGEFQFEDGYQISGILGYRLSDSLSFETDISYSQFDYDKVNLTVGGTAISGGVTFTGNANSSYVVDGTISAFSMIFGPSFDYDLNRQIELLFGGGIGFASHNDEIKSVGNSTGLSYDQDQTDFAAKFKTGFNYSIDINTFFQGEYGFNYVNSGIENYSSDFTAHTYSARLLFNF